jgi:hypothetical protein
LPAARLRSKAIVYAGRSRRNRTSLSFPIADPHIVSIDAISSALKNLANHMTRHLLDPILSDLIAKSAEQVGRKRFCCGP